MLVLGLALTSQTASAQVTGTTTATSTATTIVGTTTATSTGTTIATTTVATTTGTSTPSTNDFIKILLAQIQSLQSQIAEIQKLKLNTHNGLLQIKFASGTSTATSTADVLLLQKILATDPTIYPEGYVTGYFGPMTKNAVIKFQAKHGLRISGNIDQDTKDLINELLTSSNASSTVPYNFLLGSDIEKAKIKLQVKKDGDIKFEVKKKNSKGKKDSDED